MFSAFDFDVILRSLPYLFYQGMTFTVLLTALATLGGIVLGTLLALMRLSSLPFLTIPAAAYGNMVPVLLTQTIVLFQDTSLVYVISVTDFLGAASKVAQRDGRLVEMYLFAACVYFVISLVASRAVQQLQRRIAIIR